MHSYRFIVSGLVQGVYYRKAINERAQKMGINGYVKNLSDGTVEACATLEDDDFAAFIAMLEEGSSKSRVENIAQSIIEERFDRGFEIRY